jgi:hypothetical protein
MDTTNNERRTTNMKAVSRFEANLLRLLHCFLRRGPAEQATPLLNNRMPRPECLSRDAVDLVQDALAKGCVLELVRRGGWRRERHLRGARVVEGRLWERTPAAELGLAFSRHALDFLIWATSGRPGDEKSAWRLREQELTPADRLLAYLAYGVLREAGPERAVRGRSPFDRQALCRLAYPEDFAGRSINDVPDFAPWTAGLGACILEAMQGELVGRWLEVERGKAHIADWERLRDLGEEQERVLDAFLAAIDGAGRWDLARFLLRAAAEVLHDGVTPRAWVGGLAGTGPRLADRTATNRAALALGRQTARLQEWARRARGVGFLDDGYAAAQLWLADWEHWQGDLLHERAERLVRELDPMRTQG